MNRSDELTAMRGEVSTAGIARSVMRIAWQILRWLSLHFWWSSSRLSVLATIRALRAPTRTMGVAVDVQSRMSGK